MKGIPACKSTRFYAIVTFSPKDTDKVKMLQMTNLSTGYEVVIEGIVLKLGAHKDVAGWRR